MGAERAQDGCARLAVRDIHRLHRNAHYPPPPSPRLEAGRDLTRDCQLRLVYTHSPVHHHHAHLYTTVYRFSCLLLFLLCRFLRSRTITCFCFPLHSVRATLRYHLRTERIARMGQLFGFVCLNTRGDAGRGAHVHNLVRQRELYEGRR
jgi:hypothetical protein